MERLSLWATTALRVEDLVIVVPGRGPSQQLRRLANPVLLSSAAPHLPCRPCPLEPGPVSTELGAFQSPEKLIPGIPNPRCQLKARLGYQDSEEGCGFWRWRASPVPPCWQAPKVQNWPVSPVPPVDHSSYFTVFSLDFLCFFCSSYSSIFRWK